MERQIKLLLGMPSFCIRMLVGVLAASFSLLVLFHMPGKVAGDGSNTLALSLTRVI